MPSTDAIDLFLASAAARPEHPALVVRDQRATYAALELRVRRYAGVFAQARGPKVLIGLRQGPEAYAALLGAGLAGAYYVPLNVDVPLQKMQHIARLVQPDVIVAPAQLARELYEAAPGAWQVDPDELERVGAPLAGRGRRHEIAYVIFTSGTTGAPKGVVIPRGALDHFVDWVVRSRTVTPQDRVAQFSNIAFDVSVTDIYGALCTGASLFPVLGRADRTFPARMVARERLSVWNSTPSVISLMMQAGEVTAELLGTLRLVNLCGEPLFRSHLEALFAALPDVVVQNSYGPTETTVVMTELRLRRESYLPYCSSSVAIGTPFPGMAIHLVGGPSADEGEIAITGPQLALGYWNDPEKTADRFRTLEVDGVPVRAYFSGDWALRREGQVYFKERLDLQVKIRGFRLELDEVARAIRDQGYPVVCVLKWQEEVAAVIERQPARALDAGALRAALARQLESHAIPTEIRQIDRMPRDANDKLDRRAVAQWLAAQCAGSVPGEHAG